MGVHIFAEGDPILNTGLKEFLKRALNNELRNWRVSCSRSVSQTISAFTLAMDDNIDGKTDDALVLLLDSDEFLNSAIDRAMHLLHHKSLVVGFDRLKQRLGTYTIENNQIYFMVQEMEAWFLASLKQVIEYFQDIGVNVSEQVNAEDVELIEKPAEELRAMTGGRYKKTDHASVIFYHLDPNQVAKLPHFRLLLEHLKTLL